MDNLPDVRHKVISDKNFNQVDFIYANDVQKLLYDFLFPAIDKAAMKWIHCAFFIVMNFALIFTFFIVMHLDYDGNRVKYIVLLVYVHR